MSSKELANLLPSDLAFKFFKERVEADTNISAEVKAALLLDIGAENKVLLVHLQTELEKEPVE